MIRQRAGGGTSKRLIVRRTDQELWQKVSLQTGIDYWHIFKVFCSLFIVFGIYNFIYKGRTVQQVYQLLPSFSYQSTNAVYRPSTIEKILPREINQVTERTLCIVGLDSKDSSDAIDIAEQYLARSCGGLMFVSDQEKHTAHQFKSSKTDFVSIENKNLQHWEQRRYITYHALAHAFMYHNNFDWYIRIAKPNVLTFPENFARMVKDKMLSSADKHYLGHTLTKDGKPFNYALSAYALSRGAIFTIGQAMYELSEGNESSFRCKDGEFHTEDDFAFLCMEKEFGLVPGNSRDNMDREFFLIFQVKDHVREMKVYRDDWFWQNKKPENTGENCCAMYPVAFTNYKPSALRKLYSLVYDQLDSLSNMEIKRLSTIRT